MRITQTPETVQRIRHGFDTLQLTPMDFESLGGLHYDVKEAMTDMETMHLALCRLADQHYMMPGSHETREGAICRCGKTNCSVWHELDELGF